MIASTSCKSINIRNTNGSSRTLMSTWILCLFLFFWTSGNVVDAKYGFFRGGGVQATSRKLKEKRKMGWGKEKDADFGKDEEKRIDGMGGKKGGKKEGKKEADAPMAEQSASTPTGRPPLRPNVEQDPDLLEKPLLDHRPFVTAEMEVAAADEAKDEDEVDPDEEGSDIENEVEEEQESQVDDVQAANVVYNSAEGVCDPNPCIMGDCATISSPRERTRPFVRVILVTWVNFAALSIPAWTCRARMVPPAILWADRMDNIPASVSADSWERIVNTKTPAFLPTPA
ncbi:hypothetical protein IV203_022747 [Nitzschia inconspicua]|uniref:Uncharacterized protein n=1 Tax=Nitzschia inconspicua TaxID=303405 RepID=A0A9K3K6Q6_9STRA|nr:hypothetical protein IV203_022747 [Nitzschia inconspicua]